MFPIQSPLPTALQELTSTPDKIQTDRDAKSLKRSCQEFEAIFLQSMLKSMRKAVPDSGFFEKNTAQEVYHDMLDTEISREMSKHQSIGLADQMYRQMEKYLNSGEKNK